MHTNYRGDPSMFSRAQKVVHYFQSIPKLSLFVGGLGILFPLCYTIPFVAIEQGGWYLAGAIIALFSIVAVTFIPKDVLFTSKSDIRIGLFLNILSNIFYIVHYIGDAEPLNVAIFSAMMAICMGIWGTLEVLID